MKKTIPLSISLIMLLSATSFAAKPHDHPTSPADPTAQILSDAAPPKSAEPLSGKVLETMNSGGYSYVYLQGKNGNKVWVAVPERQVKVGDQVSFKPGLEMRRFESKSLKRTFDIIIFTNSVQSAPAATAGHGRNQEASPAAHRSTTDEETMVAVAKATEPNATTVEGAFGRSAELDKKVVVIRGKVVKVSAGIMGKNWFHIQDGTGSKAKGNHDLTCTTAGSLPTVGDVITVSGTLAKDRDFGAGYRYGAIVENATFKK
ncbi:MAG: DNA-binding protein [Deltaproteobacteria bacterium]|nr:DNA-binding protein [Deltaproteobacteria bacterium]